MKKTLGFHKSEQGIFTSELIESLKNSLRNEYTLVEVDFREAYIIGDAAFFGDINLCELDGYFWHDTIYPRSWDADNYFIHILSVMQAAGVKIVNTPESTRITNDKYLAHTKLAQAKLPVGDFGLIRANDLVGIEKIFTDFGESVLLKPRYGGWGVGIIKADSLDKALSSIEFMTSFTKNPSEPILIEKYYKNDLEKWISVVVMGDKVLFGYKKPLIGNADWKIYDPEKKDGKGALSTYVEPDAELAAVALQAKEAIGKDIIGFDFIATKDGYKIIDENGRPGLYKHCLEAAHIDIKNEIIKLITKVV